MRWRMVAGLAFAVALAAGLVGYWVGLQRLSVPGLSHFLGGGETLPAAKGAMEPIAYYQDPDGLPIYSAGPRQTKDGRPFRAVLASEDIRFDDQDAESRPAQGSGPRQILYYRNPMGLPDTSPVPRKDSMGMDYIAVYAGEDADGSSVKISPGRLQRTGVRSEPVELRIVRRPLRAPGRVQLDERRIAVVTTRSDAFIEEVASITTGDRVVKGQPLLRLYSPDIANAGAQFLSELNATARGGVVGGARQRLENLGVPLETIAEIERTRSVPLSVLWRAPRDGVVLERNVANGMKVSAGDVLFRLADISTVWVIADVPEHQLGAIQPGARTTIRIRSRPGDTFEGRVSLVYPQINEATRTASARVELPNPGGLLLPNMYADVEIGVGVASQVIAVPDSAVVDSGTRQIVILDRGEGRFEPREVKLGFRGEGYTEIRSGVAQGDRVVVAANFLIDAESNLKAALRALAPPEPRP